MKSGRSCVFVRFPQQFHQSGTAVHMSSRLTEAWPIGLRLRLDLLGLHGKLHAQTSTSWTLCAALTEAWPIGLRLRLDLLGLHGKSFRAKN